MQLVGVERQRPGDIQFQLVHSRTRRRRERGDHRAVFCNRRFGAPIGVGDKFAPVKCQRALVVEQGHRRRAAELAPLDGQRALKVQYGIRLEIAGALDRHVRRGSTSSPGDQAGHWRCGQAFLGVPRHRESSRYPDLAARGLPIRSPGIRRRRSACPAVGWDP